MLVLLIASGMCLSCNQVRDEKPSDQEAVAVAVESFRRVMLSPGQEALEALFEESLTYGHSNGLIEDRTTCIASMVTGKFNFTSLEFSEQSIDVVGNTAVVRHVMFAHTADAGKEPGTVRLHVLQVWVHKDGKWQLIARQAVRI